VRLGQLLGNRFSIKVVSPLSTKPEATVKKIFKQTNGRFLNYFGEQRFGSSRRNTHLVGEKLLRGVYEDAAMLYLSDHEGEHNAQTKSARQELAETSNFSNALKHFPKHLRLERTMLAWLALHPNDFVAAFRKLPRSILLLFIHAFQSHIFNTLLSQRAKENAFEPETGEYLCGENSYGFPDIDKRTETGGFLCMKLVGFQSELSERESALLGCTGVAQEDFRMRSIPEISSKGTYRTAFAPLKDFSFDVDTFHFTLPSGSYATTALREFIDEGKS
jgi:tRNA pseudouridine13 synthase